MTGLLVSVRDPLEAAEALRGGANVIDIKEPRNGSLGAASDSCIAAVVARVARRAPISAALGELVDFDSSRAVTLPPGVKFVKLGLAGCGSKPDWRNRWRIAARALSATAAMIAVVYADSASGAPPADQLLDEAVRIGCAGILIDTFDKRRGDLFKHWSIDRLGRQIHDAQLAGLVTVVAGSLTGETIQHVLPLEPDLVAVRGAACRGGRTGRVDRCLVSRLSRTLSGTSAV